MKDGRIFAFEGPDGVGKTSLIKQLKSELELKNQSCQVVALPGNQAGSLGELVYRLHHNPGALNIKKPGPAGLQCLHLAAHVECIQEEIKPALAEGKIVLLDRYWWSTQIYGQLDGIEPKVLTAIMAASKAFWRQARPEKVFLITSPMPFKPEIEQRQWESLVAEYEALAKGQPTGRVEHITNPPNSNQALDLVLSQILPKRGRPKASKRTDRQLSFLDSNAAPPLLEIPELTPLKPTVVYKSYWEFAAKRQEVFFKRAAGLAPPWTDDPILSEYKFTNAYRASDRVSQYLIRNVIYEGAQEPEEVLFRILIFKTFNKIETWELLKQKLGEIKYSSFSFNRYNRALSEAMQRGETIYSAAYIMTSGKSAFGHDRKHSNHLELIASMMKSGLTRQVVACDSLEGLYELLSTFPTIGKFLAYQYAIDINYSTLVNFDENEFVVAGPGAENGIRKCFYDTGGLSNAQIISFMTENQEREFARFGVKFNSLWGRPLKLIDAQNLFCETDKYARVAHPEVLGVDARTRIKRKFSPIYEPISYYFPPKWGINQEIKK
ncbi:MAG: putative DNA base hypermodification protein [bacterium]|nr:putative DNA base hypermodification protein [bacterium]